MTIIKAEMKLVLRKNLHDEKKRFHCFWQNFQSIVSLHVLKLALNKSIRASDDKQGTNKLRLNII